MWPADRFSRVCVCALFAVSLGASSACLSEATEVRVIVNSNAPTTLPVVYRAWVRDGAQLAQAAGDASLFWAQFAGRGASDGDSFSVVPRAGVARDGVFSVLVEAQSGMLVVRRVLRARFTPRVSTTLRIPLNFDCTLETSGCLGSPIPCTIQRLCEERGQTCGESGQCIPIDVVANREDGGVDGAVLSVLPRSDASAMNDAADDRARDAEDVQSIDDVADSGAADVPTMDSCAPSCAGRVCGSNGCSGSCGTCSGGLTCNGSGQCVMSCTPNCAGRVCGSNGCSGSCGSCTAPRTCNGSGQCVCTPSCAGKRCGPDGCGGSCGSCPAGLTCNGAGTGCFCPAGCSGSSSNCRDACGYSNTACRSQCPSNRTCNLGTGNCDCATITCGTTCCPTGTIYCRGSVCCTDCGRPSPVCNLC